MANRFLNLLAPPEEDKPAPNRFSALLDEEEEPKKPNRFLELMLDAPPVEAGRRQLKGAMGVGSNVASMIEAAPIGSMGPVEIPLRAGGQMARPLLEKARGALTREKDDEGAFSSPQALFGALMENLPVMVAGGAATIAGGPALGIPFMVAQEGGSQYQTLIAQGEKPEKARALAAAVGVINGSLEQLPILRLLGGKMSKKVILEGAKQALAEFGTEGLQEYVSQVSEGEVAPQWGRILESAGMGGILGGGTGMAVAKGQQQAGVETPEAPVQLPTTPMEEAGTLPVLPAEEVAADLSRVRTAIQKADGSIFTSAKNSGVAPHMTLVEEYLESGGKIEDLQSGGFLIDGEYKDYSQEDLPIELSDAIQVERGEMEAPAPVVPPGAPPADPSAPLYTFSRPEVEEQVQSSVAPIREVSAPFPDKARTWLHGWSREYQQIAHGAENVNFRESMRRIREAPDNSAREVARALNRDIGHLTPAEHNLFIKKRLIDDLRVVVGTYPEGVEMPFEITPEDLMVDGPGLDQAVASSPRVQAAIEADQRSYEADRQKLREGFEALDMRTDFLDRRGETYLHHMVIDHAQTTPSGPGGEKGLKKPGRRGYQKELKGSKKNISLAYAQAQGKVRMQLRIDGETAAQMARIKRDSVMPEVKETAKEWNRRLLSKRYQETDGLSREEADAAAEALTPQEVRDALGPEFKTWRHVLPQYVNQGYATYHPGSGRNFFSAWTVPERAAMEAIEQGIAEITGEEVGKVMTSAPAEPWILPREMVEVLEEHGQRTGLRNRFGVNRKLQNLWKKAALFLPRRVVKYVSRNFISDWSVVLQGAPHVATNPAKILGSMREVASYVNGDAEAGPELQQWLDRGGLSAGLFTQELTRTDKERLRRVVNSTEAQRAITEMGRGLVVKPGQAYWKFIQQNVAILESTMRFAVFKDTLAEIEATGAPQHGYMGSIKEEIDALEDPADKAYWLSNELIGAYDMVSQYGQITREQLVPFWSFQELNARTQIRLLKNAVTAPETVRAHAIRSFGAGAVARAPLTAMRAAKFLLLANALPIFLTAFNRLVNPEADDELPLNEQKRPHITLGRDSEGNVITFNRLSRFHEFLEWFGAGTPVADAQDFLNGRRTADQIAADMLRESVDKAWNSISPLGPKGAVEFFGKIKTFPHVTRPRIQDDRWRVLFEMFGLEKDYDILLNRPMKSGGKGRMGRWIGTIPEAFIYKYEPGRTAWGDMWSLRASYDRSKGVGGTLSMHSSQKSIALRRFKQAVAYGQPDVAMKNLWQYKQLGGSADGIRDSVQRMDPLFGLDAAEKEEFLAFLAPDEREVLDRAHEYYRDVLQGGILDIPQEQYLKIFGEESVVDLNRLRLDSFLRNADLAQSDADLWREAKDQNLKAEGVDWKYFRGRMRTLRKKSQ